MFSRLPRLPLRRCIHTAPQPRTPRLGSGKTTRTLVAGSALATAFVAYQLSRKANQVALDAPPTIESHAETHLAHSAPASTRLKDSSSPPAFSSTPSSSSERDAFLPDDSSSTPPDSSPPNPDSETNSGDTVSAEGEEAKPAASGAFNPETGEINWDCPCLGGMAHGPCGPEFKEAFSCFVFSEAEPKGINCVDKFQNMQNCFRAHPEVYADEIMDDDDEPPVSEDSETLTDPADSEKAESEASADTKTVPKSPLAGSQPTAESS